MKDRWRRYPKRVPAFFLASLKTSFFLARIIWQTVCWSNRQNVEVPPWLTVG